MALNANSQLLVDNLQSLSLLDGRFANIRLANWNSATNQKRGCFSLVFSVDDILNGTRVALKFYDLDPALAHDKYRRASFLRENEILKQLVTVDRCLQLVQEMRDYHLSVSVTGAGLIVIPCQYFVVEWLDDEVDEYFFDQQKHDSVAKLKIFNEIVLAVEALHGREVFHRDLKADNLRAAQKALKRLVVAIDLGTAARFDSAHIATSYGHAVGAPIYAPSEAHCGLSGNREIAPYSDVYALGCLLYELFNLDFFFRALHAQNANINLRLAAMSPMVAGQPEDKQVALWISALSKFGAGVTPIAIDGPGNYVPAGIASLLNDVLVRLTHFDFRRRPLNLDWVRGKIWTAMRILENDRMYKLRLARVRENRRRKLEHARKVDARRNRYLGRSS